MDSIDAQIRDDDLRERLNRVGRGPGSETLTQMLVKEQQERDRVRALSPIQRRRDEARKTRETQKVARKDQHHIHSVLALCGLPYRRPPDGQRDYIREYGKSSLAVTSGLLKNPETGKMEPQGLPYGPKARLLMLHICTMAVRQKSPEIEIAGSMSAFIRELGFAVTGGKRGTLTQFKEQLNRLAAAHMTIGLWKGETTRTIKANPIDCFDIWLPKDPDQKVLWSSRLRLNDAFYESLRQHALPVDIVTLRAFSQSAKQIDMVMWLAYRIPTIKKPYRISWAALKEQFGNGVGEMWKFKQGFAKDFEHIQEVYPSLPVRLMEVLPSCLSLIANVVGQQILRRHFCGIVIPQTEGICSCMTVGWGGEFVSARAEDCVDLIMGGQETLRLTR